MKIKSMSLFAILIYFTMFNNFIFSQNGNNQGTNRNIEINNNSKISISLKGGIIYHYPGAGISSYGEYFNTNIETRSFISSLIFSYEFDEKQFIDLGISFITSNNNASNKYSANNSNYKIYPISLSYKYVTKNHLSKLRPFVGVGFSYIINSVKHLVTGTPDRDHNYNLNTSGYGLDLYTGLLFSFTNRVNLTSEVKISFRDEYAFADFNIGQSSLSLQLLFGIGYSL